MLWKVLETVLSHLSDCKSILINFGGIKTVPHEKYNNYLNWISLSFIYQYDKVKIIFQI